MRGLIIAHTRRRSTFLDFPAAIGATLAVRAQNDSFAAFWDAYNVPHSPRFRHPSVPTAYDSNQTKLFSGDWPQPFMYGHYGFTTPACVLLSLQACPTSAECRCRCELLCSDMQGHSSRRLWAPSRGTCWTAGSPATLRTMRCSWSCCHQRRCASLECGVNRGCLPRTAATGHQMRGWLMDQALGLGSLTCCLKAVEVSIELSHFVVAGVFRVQSIAGRCRHTGNP